MQPDVIINPHAFPSRMTIGMFVESLAGKAGALHGLAQDATPFTWASTLCVLLAIYETDSRLRTRYREESTPSAHFGRQLLAAGYNYHGNEPMYSGITGEEFAADIYLGVVYYQRLRHMVGDKWQVRTTGRVDQLTRQPVKVCPAFYRILRSRLLTRHLAAIPQGRKRGGGIRFGEMERDALLAHGTSYLLQDRLMNCSDYSTAWICRTCGSLATLGFDDGSGVVEVGSEASGSDHNGPTGEFCRVCRQTGAVSDVAGNRASVRGDMDVIAVPYVRPSCAIGSRLVC